MKSLLIITFLVITTVDALTDVEAKVYLTECQNGARPECILKCVYEKYNILSKDGKFHVDKYDKDGKILAAKCDALTSELESCTRINTYHMCYRKFWTRAICARKLNVSNGNDPNSKCSIKCILTVSNVLTPNGDFLDAAKLNPSQGIESRKLYMECAQKFKNREDCIRQELFLNCYDLSLTEKACGLAVSRKEIKCVSLCQLMTLGLFTKHGELDKSYNSLPVQEMAMACYEPLKHFEECKRADGFLKCMYDK